MEREIEAILNLFICDFDQNKLMHLDNLLFSLLLKKEIFLLRKRQNQIIKKIERALSHYWNYRDLIYERLLVTKDNDGGFLTRNIYIPPARLILLLTHRCQLRCKYCRIRKFPADMNEEILFKAIDLLFTSNRRDLQLQFFGGEPLLRFELIKKAVAYVERINEKLKQDLMFILTTNGISLTKEKIDFLRNHNFLIECSIDGEIESQLRNRQEYTGRNYYRQVVNNFGYLFNSKIPHYSISVVMPSNVSSMYTNFQHLIRMGFRRVQMNYSLGVYWPENKIRVLFQQTGKILSSLSRLDGVEFINLTQIRKEPVVLNAELTVDYDGGVYLESGICLEEDFISMKNKFLVTDIGKAKNINFYNSTPFQNFYRLSKIYASNSPKFRKIILNNIFLGKRYERLIKNAWSNRQ